MIGVAGRPRRGAVHLVDFLPRLHMRIDSAVSGGGGQQLRVARLWEDVTPGAGDEGDERDGGWRLRDRPVIEARAEPYAHCGRALDDPTDGLEGMNAPVQVPCDHGGLVHGHFMLERADRIAPVSYTHLTLPTTPYV